MPKEGDLKFSERYHKYTIYRNGKWYNPPSVSKIKDQMDKPALKGWAVKVTANYCIKEILPLVASSELVLLPEDYERLFKKAKRQHIEEANAAATIGTETHKAIERHLLTKQSPVGLSEKARKSFGAYLSWEKENKVNLGQIFATELPFYCKEHDFCGTLDRMSNYINNKLYIIDYKTTKDFWDVDMAVQLAGYWLGAEELIRAGKIEGLAPDTKIEGAGILRLDKETGFPYFKDYTSRISTATQIFIMLRNILDLTESFKDINGLESQ